VIRSRTRHPLPRRDEFRGTHDLSLFEALGGRLPSALAIVTGPSRSGDIEQQQVVGVHRPGEGQIVLTEPYFRRLRVWISLAGIDVQRQETELPRQLDLLEMLTHRPHRGVGSRMLTSVGRCAWARPRLVSTLPECRP
jgi:hypothetical protein